MMKEKLPVRGTNPDAEVSPFVIFHTLGSFSREDLHEKVEKMENQGRIILFSGKTEGLSAEEAGWNSSFSMQTRHFHSELELYLLMEGERYYFVDQNTYHLVPHTGILIGINRIHKTSVCPENPAHRRFLLEYSPNPYDMLLKGLHYPDFEGFGSEFAGPVCFEQDEWERVCLLITELKEKMTAGEARSSVVLKGMELLDFYAICARRRKMENSGKPQGLVPGKETERIHQVIDEIAQYLQQHCSESIRLDELSVKFYISRSRMTYMFKQITGFTVVEYLSFVRVRKAEGLLCETDLSITEIAGETGFGNVTYFERVFRTATGLAPLQYRKKNRNA